MKKTNFTLLTKANNHAEAHLIKAYLNELNIESYIQGENHRSLYGILGTFIDLRILVPTADIEKSRKAFQEYQSSSNNQQAENTSHKSKNSKENNNQRFLTTKKSKLFLTIVCALFLTFGMGHASVEKYKTAFALALLQVISLICIFLNVQSHSFFIIVLSGIFYDLLGSLWTLKNSR